MTLFGEKNEKFFRTLHSIYIMPPHYFNFFIQGGEERRVNFVEYTPLYVFQGKVTYK